MFDPYARVLFNVGEGATSGDQNDLQTSMLAQLYDQILAATVPNLTPGSGSDPSFNEGFQTSLSPYAIALTGTGARVVVSAGPPQLKISPGTVFQAVGTPDGLDRKFLAYTFSGSEPLITIAPGDASNPRVDIIQVKLESVVDPATTQRDFRDATTGAITTTLSHKRARVQCTISYKQGTPAASPSYPALDAGCVALAGLVVGTNWTTNTPGIEDVAGANVCIHDQRVPLGVSQLVVAAPEMHFGSNWTLSGARDVITSGSSASDVKALLRTTSPGRLLGVSAFCNDPSALTTHVAKFTASDSGVGGLTLSANNLNLAGVGGSGANRHARRYNPMGSMSHTPGSGPTVLANVAGVGAPMWSSGKRAPFDFTTGAFPQPYEGLCLLFSGAPTGVDLGPVTFWIAGGL